MPDPRANERIEPLPFTGPLHLHERNGTGLSGQAKKDPTNAVNGVDGNGFPSIPGFFPPLSLLPPFELPPSEPPGPIGPIDPGPGEGDPPTPPEVGAFIYFNGAWWAAVEYDIETGSLIDPYWYQFAPASGGGGGANLRYNTDNGNVEYWDGAAWVSWSTLPTSDPGGGAIWLSAT